MTGRHRDLARPVGALPRAFRDRAGLDMTRLALASQTSVFLCIDGTFRAGDKLAK